MLEHRALGQSRRGRLTSCSPAPRAHELQQLEIVETAERLFREVGLAKCSVEAIIREIGIAKGTVYHHFKSKEEILGAIVERALGALLEQAAAVADAPALDAMSKMELLPTDARIVEQGNREGVFNAQIPLETVQFLLTGAVEMRMVCLVALGFGLIAGFAVPAGQSIVPMVVETRDL